MVRTWDLLYVANNGNINVIYRLSGRLLCVIQIGVCCMLANVKLEQQQLSRNIVQKNGIEKTVASPSLAGIHDTMKARFENLSGFSFDDVRKHYNSGKPAQLQALAYAQGNQVYVAPEQEQHLGHELGHVLQQKQGIIKPTLKSRSMPINSESSLEADADNYAVRLSVFAPVLENKTAQLNAIDVSDKKESWDPLGLIQMGGRQWTTPHNQTRLIIVDLAEKVVQDLRTARNTVCATPYINIPQNSIEVTIAGSLRVMELDSDHFISDDIDIDIYDTAPDDNPVMPGAVTPKKEHVVSRIKSEFL